LTELARWQRMGLIRPAQHDSLSALVRKERISVFVELHTTLYLGVVAAIGGVGWTIQTHFTSLGDAAIISALTLAFGAALNYCFARAPVYSPGRVASPGFAFDYVLYFGCLAFGLALGYLEFRFEFLKTNWDLYLLMAAGLFFALAYRFDNRFVLSLALSTLAGWFGVRLTHFPEFGGASLRGAAIVYGGIVAAAGAGLFRAGIKPHFLDAYLHVAANVVFVALLSALLEWQAPAAYLVGLIALAALAVAAGLRFRRFAFVVYGVLYGYGGISARVMRHLDSTEAALAYFVISSTIVVGSIAVLARRFGRDE
jgi:hypothetical protein